MYHVFLLKLCTWSYFTNRIGHDFLLFKGPEKVLNFDYVIRVGTMCRVKCDFNENLFE